MNVEALLLWAVSSDKIVKFSSCKMRASKISSGSSGCCPWIVAIATSLLMLLALSRSFLRDPMSATGENFQLPASIPSKEQGKSPVLAYWICGTSGDGQRILRLLKATYHPRNLYLLQLDSDSSEHERSELALSVQSESVFRAFGNVNVVGKSYAVNQMGASALSAVLHASALLLKLSAGWDWFINLSASDYPLVTQDDLLHAISSLPRDLNFIHYINSSDFLQRREVNQIVMDPSLYLQKRSHLFYAVERRATPDAFNIFGGSPWLILTRSFMEYCVQGWDNTPRKLLMYFSNTVTPLEFYFHTVLCNAHEFRNATLNHDLRYHITDNLEKGEESWYDKMVSSGAAFARPFKEDDPMLSKIDEDVLFRLPNGIVPGTWCSGEGVNENVTESLKGDDRDDLCSNFGNIDGVKAVSNGIKLELLLSKLVDEGRLISNQCHM